MAFRRGQHAQAAPEHHRAEQAEEELLGAVQEDAENTEAFLLLGRIYQQEGLPARAAGMFRLEGELGYKRAKHDEYNANEGICVTGICGGIAAAAVTTQDVEGGIDFDGDGSTRVWSLMANALLDLPIGENAAFYVGPGIGWASTRITSRSRTNARGRISTAMRREAIGSAASHPVATMTSAAAITSTEPIASPSTSR